MDLRSDYQRVQHLMETEHIDDIQFSDDESHYSNPQRGGYDDNDNDYDYDYKSHRDSQHGGYEAEADVHDTAQQEHELHKIFKKAQHFRDTIHVNDQHGGDDVKKSRGLPVALQQMHVIAKIVKENMGTNKIPPKNLLQVAKIILNEAKEKHKTKDLTPAVKSTSEALAAKPDKFIEEWRKTSGNTAAASRIKSKSKKLYNSKIMY